MEPAAARVAIASEPPPRIACALSGPGRAVAERRPHILVLAWLVSPQRGSEWAAAWGMVRVAAELGEVTVLCRPDCEAEMRAWCLAHPEVPIEVHAVPPVDGWLRRLAGIAVKGHFFDYFAWLAALPPVIAAIHGRHPVDLAVHAALGCQWLPSPISDLDVPTIWGSVGGSTPTAPGLWPVLGPVGVVERAIERLVVRAGMALPATRRTMRRASLVLLEAESVRPHMPAEIAASAVVFRRALLAPAPVLPPEPRGFDVIFPSGLTARKGAILAVEAFVDVPAPYRLVFVNDGPEAPRLLARARALGIADRVELRGAVPRQDYFRMLRAAPFGLFTGVNEEGGCALCEAMMLGVPVVVLAHGGPAEIVDGWSLDPSRVVAVKPAGGVVATARALGLGMRTMIGRGGLRRDPYLDQARAAAELTAIYRRVLGMGNVTSVPAERVRSPAPA